MAGARSPVKSFSPCPGKGRPRPWRKNSAFPGLPSARVVGDDGLRWDFFKKMTISKEISDRLVESLSQLRKMQAEGIQVSRMG